MRGCANGFTNHSFNLVIFLVGMVIFLCGFSLTLDPALFDLHHPLIISTVITITLTRAVSKIISTLCSVFSPEKPTEISWSIFHILVFYLCRGGLPWGCPFGNSDWSHDFSGEYHPHSDSCAFRAFF